MEVSALKKASVDFEKMQLHVKGTWITAEGGFQNKTKNKGSYRSIDIEPNGAAFKFLNQEISLLKNIKVIVALGKIGFDACTYFFKKNYNFSNNIKFSHGTI